MALTQKEFGRLDLTVNCAGVGIAVKTYNSKKDKVHELEDFQRVINVSTVLGGFHGQWGGPGVSQVNGVGVWSGPGFKGSGWGWLWGVPGQWGGFGVSQVHGVVLGCPRLMGWGCGVALDSMGRGG